MNKTVAMTLKGSHVYRRYFQTHERLQWSRRRAGKNVIEIDNRIKHAARFTSSIHAPARMDMRSLRDRVDTKMSLSSFEQNAPGEHCKIYPQIPCENAYAGAA